MVKIVSNVVSKYNSAHQAKTGKGTCCYAAYRQRSAGPEWRIQNCGDTWALVH